MCTLRLCAKAPTVAIVNLHEWLEVSKQWGNRALPIMARYWYRCLVCLLWAQRNSFHLLSGRTMLLVLCCLLRAGMLKWWDVPVCHCMFCHRVSICSCTQTSVHCRHQSSLGAACDFSLYIFEERTPLQERMIMLLPRGKALRSIRVRIPTAQRLRLGKQRGHSQRKERPAAFHHLSRQMTVETLPMESATKTGGARRGWPHSTHCSFLYT